MVFSLFTTFDGSLLLYESDLLLYGCDSNSRISRQLIVIYISSHVISAASFTVFLFFFFFIPHWSAPTAARATASAFDGLCEHARVRRLKYVEVLNEADFHGIGRRMGNTDILLRGLDAAHIRESGSAAKCAYENGISHPQRGSKTRSGTFKQNKRVAFTDGKNVTRYTAAVK